MSDILVIGWITLDFVGKVDDFPTMALNATAGDFDAACGGRGANQAMAVTAVEGDVALIARVGEDKHSSLLTDELDDLDIDRTMVDEAPSATGMRIIAQRPDGKTMTVVHPGANEYLTVDDLNRRSAAFGAAKVVGVTAEPAGAVVLRALDLAAQAGVPSVLTHTPGAQVTDRVLAACNVLVVSVPFGTGLLDPGVAGEQPEYAARALVQRGAQAVVLLTADGAVVATAGHADRVPSPTPLDGEDAVDAFVGGMLTGLAQGENVRTAAVRGVRIACLLVD